MIPFRQYAANKDRYCVAYLGHANEYVIELKLLRPHIERSLPGLELWIACRDESLYLLADEARVLGKTELHARKADFGQINVLASNLDQHPLEQMLMESQISIPRIEVPEAVGSDCLVIPEERVRKEHLASFRKAVREAESSGFTILQECENPAMTIGYESERLVRALEKGALAKILPGVGRTLLGRMFRKTEMIG